MGNKSVESYKSVCICWALCARQDPELVDVTSEFDLHQIMLWFVCVLLKLNYWNPGTGRGVSTLLEDLFAFMRMWGGGDKANEPHLALTSKLSSVPHTSVCV